MLEDERGDDPPDASDARREPAPCAALATSRGAGEPGEPEPVLVQARATPLPRVDGALLALSVHLLRDVRPPQRNFCPPPNPPAGKGPQAFAPFESDDRYEYEAYQEDSSISLIERIEGVSRPISSRPPPSRPEVQTEQERARRRRRILAWIGVAAGVVHCMVLALVLSAPARPKLIVDDTTEAAPALSFESLAKARAGVGERNLEARAGARARSAEADEQAARPARPRAGALESTRAASRARSIELAPHSHGKRHRFASLRSLKRKRRHASAMRRAPLRRSTRAYVPRSRRRA